GRGAHASRWWLPLERSTLCPTRAALGGWQARGVGRGRLALVGKKRGIRAPPLQGGLPGTAGGEAVSAPILLSRGAVATGPPPYSPRPAPSKSASTAPSLSRSGRNYHRQRFRGDWAGQGYPQRRRNRAIAQSQWPCAPSM